MQNSQRKEFKRLKSSIEKEHREKLKALYILYPDFRAEAESSNEPSNDVNTYGKLSGLIRQALSKFTQPFTLHDMILRLNEIDPVYAKTVSKIQVSNTLGRFVKKNKLEKVPDSMPVLYKRKT